ncbi:MAG TPA: BTAD domain-containing putative transcriptional regulator [Ilumatobacteraceae bacterium]|nr:BTAD domain-containing putative transcriptional regulator [Ilumatobacteraceae bacterium]
MDFGVLGPLRVTGDDGAEAEIGSPTQRIVLATLLARPGQVVPLDVLAEAVWEDSPPVSAVNTLRSQISRLRRVVGERVRGSADGYSLVLAGGDGVDATRFDDALRRARADHDVGDLVTALGAWRGRAYGELADTPGVRSEARRLELARLDATELVAAADLAAGRFTEAAAACEAVVAADDVREPSWALLVRALTRAGRPAEALRAARRAAAALRDAGLVPGLDLRGAEREALEAPTAAPAGPGSATVAAVVAPPAPLTPTIGREDDQRAVVAALGTARLVTMVGPGGVGKTRLALDVARELAARHGRGAVVAELARVADGPGVASTIVAALDLRSGTRPDRPPLDGAGAIDALLVLDNCEHVVDAVADIAPLLLRGGDRLRLLATSREPLALDGEHVVPIAPLPTAGATSPATELFRQRAAAAAPGALDGTFDRHLVAELVGRVDGLPLALEMAAARLRTMTLAELTSSIGTDLDVLASARRDVDPRHRTVRDLVAWSERLLDDDLRAGLLGFSVFAGPVLARELPAAVPTPRPADTVARLVDRSLVLAMPSSTGVRFGALETIRGYGLERLRATGGYDAARLRHATWFADVVAEIDAQLRTVDEPAGMRRFEEVVDEVRAAVRWSLDHDLDLAARLTEHAYTAGRSQLRAEVVSWLEDVAARLPADHPRAVRVRSALVGGLAFVGRLDEAKRSGAELLAGGAAPSDLMYALEGLGDIATYEGRLDESLDLWAQMRVAADQRGDPLYADLATVGLAIGDAYAGRSAAALATLAAGPTCPGPSGTAWFEYVTGESILDLDPPVAIEHLDRAEAAARIAGNRFLTEVSSLSATTLRARHGDLADAARRFAALLDHFGDGGDPSHLVTTVRNLVTLLVRLGHHRVAAVLLGAVADSPAPPSYGPEAERLDAAAEECRRALGRLEYERMLDRGRARPLEDGLAAARTALLATTQ